MTSWIPITIVTLYVAVLFAVTGWARRLTAKGGGGIVGYLLAGRGLPYWVAAALLAGLAVGGVSTIGIAERAYTRRHLRRLVQRGLGGRRLRPRPSARRGATADRDHDPARALRAPLQHDGACPRGDRPARDPDRDHLPAVRGRRGDPARRCCPGSSPCRRGCWSPPLVFVGITLIGGFWAAGLTNVINVIVIYIGIVLAAVMSVARVGGLGALEAACPRLIPVSISSRWALA